jgi:hypothetical protein
LITHPVLLLFAGGLVARARALGLVLQQTRRWRGAAGDDDDDDDDVDDDDDSELVMLMMR